MKARSRAAWERMTVAELRAECGRLGLPKYQANGKRLKKADLVDQLVAAGGKQGSRRRARAEAAAKRPSPPPAKITDEQAIVIALGELPVSETYAEAMYGYMRGRRDPHTQRVLTIRRLQAIQRLRDDSADTRTWNRWNGHYVTTLAGLPQ